MKVLSLFDGMSCGRIALERAGIPVTEYYAAEVDPYAMTVTNKNYPNTVQLGDITLWKSWNIPTPDIILAGSPCQGFSVANSNKENGDGFNHVKSKLYYSFMDILNHYSPKYFLLENVSMKPGDRDIISKAVGVSPILLNSALVSAQNRKRLYWTNIPYLFPPTDKGILLKDIVELGTGKPINPVTMTRKRAIKNIRDLNSKSNCLLASIYKGAQANGTSIIKDGNDHRLLTPRECEALQTVPLDYTKGVSDTQRYKMLGNGWTVDIIAYILKGIL